jgi:hypothetical protein
VKTRSTFAILAAVAAASFAGMTLVAPIAQAQAGKGGNIRDHRGATAKTPSTSRAPFAGTYKASPEIRDHRTSATDTRPGGVSVGTRRGRLPKSYFQGKPAPRRCNPMVWAGRPAVCRDHR